jgi:hypothetical protein
MEGKLASPIHIGSNGVQVVEGETMRALTELHLERVRAEFGASAERHRTVGETIEAMSPSELQKLLPLASPWSDFYEMTYLEHLALTLWGGGLLASINMPGKAFGSIGALLNNAQAPEPTPETFAPRVGVTSLFCLWHSLRISAIAYRTYGKTLSKLFEEVRGGNDSALFKAIRIDRSIVSSPTVAKRIAIASFDLRPHFFKKLRRALKSREANRKEEYESHRLIVRALTEVGDLDKLFGSERYRLFCDELNVYATRGFTTDEGLHRFIQKWCRTSAGL